MSELIMKLYRENTLDLHPEGFGKHLKITPLDGKTPFTENECLSIFKEHCLPFYITSYPDGKIYAAILESDLCVNPILQDDVVPDEKSVASNFQANHWFIESALKFLGFTEFSLSLIFKN